MSSTRPSVQLAIHLSVALCVLLSHCRASHAHGTAIEILVNDSGQLDVFTFESGLPLGEPARFEYVALNNTIFTPDPGFGVLNAANGVAANTRLDLHLVSPLLYWDGSTQQTPESSLTMLSPDGVDMYVASAESGVQSGMTWGVYSGELFWDEHSFYFLDPVTAPSGLYGIWAEVDSPTYVASQPFLLPFIYDPQQQLTTAQVDLGFGELLTTRPALPGDYDSNRQLDASDIDRLTLAARQQETDERFDLNLDGSIDQEDRRIWVEDLKQTYFGDANLDFEFNSTDLVTVLQAGEYEDSIEDNSTWATGDWDGDGDFGTGDLVASFQSGGYEIGPRSMRVGAVPEPSTFSLLVLALLPLIHYRRMH